MRYTLGLVMLAASAVSAYSYGNTTSYTTTEVVTSYTTYCPGPTEVVEGSHTYTVTEATTLTITDCPCTLTKTYSVAPEPTHDAPEYSAPADTPEYTTPAGTGVMPTGGEGNGTAPTAAPAPSDVYEGAATRATVAGGALAGLLGAVAYLL